MDSNKVLELLCNNKKIKEYSYDTKTTVKGLKENISNYFSVNLERISLIYDKKKLDNDGVVLDQLLLTKISQVGGERLKVRIIPQIHIEPIEKVFHFKQVQNELNYIPLTFNSFIKVGALKAELSSYFNKLFSDLNYIVENVKFLTDPVEDLENADYNTASNDLFLSQVFKNKDNYQFFMMKNNSVNIYSNPGKKVSSEIIPLEKVDSTNLLDAGILRKNISTGETFNVIIQTYNSVIRELRISNNMTVFELKQLIERDLKIGIEYQELFFLVYRFNKNDVPLYMYNIKPNSTIFLRGFYFPIIFSDFFTKKQSYIKINIATKVNQLKRELKCKFGIEEDGQIELVCNGKNLDNDKYLIEYCIQKLQTIYIK